MEVSFTSETGSPDSSFRSELGENPEFQWVIFLTSTIVLGKVKPTVFAAIFAMKYLYFKFNFF